MKNKIFNVILIGGMVAIFSCNQKQELKEASSSNQLENSKSGEPWTEKQLIEPVELAGKIETGKAPVIFNIGPSGSIKNSIEIGPTKEQENIVKLKRALTRADKTIEVVIYCGCCPFTDCPNIRPAFQLLNDLGFSNSKLLNLPENLKVNWIDKGYPMEI